MKTLQELRALEDRVRSEDPDALYQRGMMCWTGRWIEGLVVLQDKEKALDMIQRAAAHGHEAAALFMAERGRALNGDVGGFRESNSPTSDSVRCPTAAIAEAAPSAESTRVPETSVAADDKANPFLLLGFWEFAILSTLTVAFFPWSLLFSLMFFGMDATKLLVLALLHDFLKTLRAVVTVVLSVLSIVIFLMLIFAPV